MLNAFGVGSMRFVWGAASYGSAASGVVEIGGRALFEAVVDLADLNHLVTPTPASIDVVLFIAVQRKAFNDARAYFFCTRTL
ncbi:hypothetical protein XH92_08150 [Bradyrhizobium sp. CCBAU 53421]|nr:hypothetical protein XH92_08150 [Bradyrhizobium sp. CCBAU 53421]